MWRRLYKNQHTSLYNVLTYVFHVYLLVYNTFFFQKIIYNTYIKYYVQTLGMAAAKACQIPDTLGSVLME